MGDKDDRAFKLTPKGKLAALLMKHGLSFEAGDEVWDELQGFCMKQLRADHPEAAYAALIFDGGGGTVVGADSRDTAPEGE